MLLEGGLRWQALSLSQTDMDFAGLKAAAARDIALAFGVPPVLLGLPDDATFSNYREAPDQVRGLAERSCALAPPKSPRPRQTILGRGLNLWKPNT